MRILIAAIIIWIGMSLSSHSKIPESKRSQKAEARFAAPLEAALKKKGLELGNPIFLRITKTQSHKNKQDKLEAFVENGDGDFDLFKT